MPPFLAIGSSGKRVLVVVDNPALGGLLLDALEDAGHEGEPASGSTEALVSLATSRFDVVIVDLENRSVDGARLLRSLQHDASTTTTIALLPVGGLRGKARPPCDIALEKPARLQALLVALTAEHAG